MRILLADDSRAMRTTYRTVLQRIGYSAGEIVEAQDGSEVLSAFRNPDAPVDMVVFDWDLPGLDGMGFMTQLKSFGLAGKVTVLLSVNRQQRALLPQLLRIGPCDSIDRPFTEEMFEAKFRSLGRSAAMKSQESSRALRSASGSIPPMARPASSSTTPAARPPSSSNTPAARPPSGTMAPVAEIDPAMPFLLLLPSAVIDDLLKAADERHFEVGTVLLRAGQICDALHIVTGGEVEIHAAGRPGRIAGEGDLFGEFSFMMSEPSGYTVKARKPVSTASLSKARISELLRKHPLLDKHLSSFMGRHKEVMTARATTIVQSDFKGTFDTMPFANVVQILNAGRKTGVLGIRQGELSGGIYLSNGEAVHAWTENTSGEQAFYDLASWTKAKWAFNSMRREEQRTLTRPLLTLLMEAMRRSEEAAPAAPTPPPAATSEDVGLDALFPSQ